MVVSHPHPDAVQSRLPDITCTDVVMALQALGQTEFTARTLSHFVRKHVHGTDTGSEPDYVFV